MAEEHVVELPIVATVSRSNTGWHVIQAGKELGPFSLDELVEKAAAGEIGAGDLVKETGGLWTKASEIEILQEQFRLRDAKEDALERLSRFHGVWLSKKTLLVCGGVLLFLASSAAIFAIGCAVIWATGTPAEDADAFFKRGNVWLIKKDYDRAIQDFSEAIRLDPKYVLAYRKRAVAWSNKNEALKAIADYDEAIRLEPTCARDFFSRGNAWFDQQDYDKAIKDLAEAVRLDPKDIAIRENPNYLTAFFRRAKTWSDKKEFDKAIKDYDEVIHLNPDCAVAFFRRGSTWCAKHEYGKALNDYNEAVRLDPQDIALRGDPNYAAMFRDEGNKWLARNEFGKAIRAFDEAIRLEPTDASGYQFRGRVRRFMKDYDRAIMDHDEAKEMSIPSR